MREMHSLIDFLYFKKEISMKQYLYVHASDKYKLPLNLFYHHIYNKALTVHKDQWK